MYPIADVYNNCKLFVKIRTRYKFDQKILIWDLRRLYINVAIENRAQFRACTTTICCFCEKRSILPWAIW